MNDDLISRKKAIDTFIQHIGVPASVWIGKAAEWLQEVPAECGHCKDCDNFSYVQIPGYGYCDEMLCFKKETGFCDQFTKIE